MLRANPLTTWAKNPDLPSIAPDAYVDETAVVIGAVKIESGVIVCPGAVLRADEGFPIIIGAGSNIQDNVVIHALKGTAVEIGPRCSIAHGAIVHGPCTIGPDSFVGFQAILLKTNIGKGCFIGHGAMVLNVDIPDGRYVPPGAIVKTADEVEKLGPVPQALRAFAEEVLEVNKELVHGYREIQAADGGS
ncbi:gamma carbonic anhydrase family protein [Thermodesulfitimonas autotrophica]|uniref:gamma carbonic anhydrase family protein n=1 Tax=Thermodesulfitimonas autotrophica TaxID=1894989 RepID=UPI002FE0DCAE